MNHTVSSNVIAAITIFMSALGLQGCTERKHQVNDRKQNTQVAEAPTDETVNEEGQVLENASEQIASISYKLYIENSASMNGYFNEEAGAIDMRLSLFKLCQKVGCKDLAFINAKEITTNGDADEIIKKMSLKDFQNYGKKGSPASSDISNILTHVVSETSSFGSISFLVSDFIFCPTKNMAFTSLGPEAEKSTITQIFENKGLAIAIFQLEAQFVGQFFTGHYEKTQGKTTEVNYKISQKRPYYIWAIGGVKEIGQLVKRTDLSDIGIKNTLTLALGNINTSYQLLPKKGSYNIDRKCNTHAIDAKVGNRGRFQVDIQVNNLELLPVDDNYILDVQNYETNDDNYSVESIKKNGNKYIITIESERVKAGALSVYLKIKTPEWVSDCNMDSSWDIRTSGCEYKTFGIKALVDGAKEAMTKNSDNYTTLDIKIN